MEYQSSFIWINQFFYQVKIKDWEFWKIMKRRFHHEKKSLKKELLCGYLVFGLFLEYGDDKWSTSFTKDGSLKQDEKTY